MTQERHGPKRSGPKRRLPWDAILDAWARGEPQATISRSCGVQENSLRVVIHYARKRGDVRAVRRRNFA